MANQFQQLERQFQDFFDTPEGIPFADAFNPVEIDSFEDQAGEDVSEFFGANLENALKGIQQAKDQFKESRAQAERQEDEAFKDFQGVQDRGFAKALGRASGRFAGKGTATSGARRDTLGDFFQGKDDTLEAQEREKRQLGERRDLDFTQFIGRSDLEEEGIRLTNERNKRQEQSVRQQQLFDSAVTGKKVLQEGFEDRFSKFLGA